MRMTGCESAGIPGKRPAPGRNQEQLVVNSCGRVRRAHTGGVFMYGQTAANGVAVMSYLAERPGKSAGSGEVAEARGISRVLAAKLLTRLAAAGLVSGRPGPGGGYKLAKPAKDIRLIHIVSLFGKTEPPSVCPFGRGWCERGEKCPLHDDLVGRLERDRKFLEGTRLSVFESRKDKRRARRG